MLGNTKNLDDSRTEALQALFNSLSPGADPSSQLSPLQLKQLADKIDEVLGGGGDNEGSRINEKGELINDEGLPIIDISEPAADIVDVHSMAAPFHEPNLIPLSSLSVSELEERRKMRDRVLDMLEEEERLQFERNEEEEKERQKDDIRKRKEAMKGEVERLKAAKDMQKKMGKALLRNIAETREKEERELKELAESEPPKSESSKPKKTVTFASSIDEPPPTEERQTTGSAVDWGDITPARLRSTRANVETHPMRKKVVERFPVSFQPSSEALSEGDSDDEPLSTSSLANNEYRDTPYESRDLDSETDDDESDEGVLEEEYDLDSAHHHREIALEYYKKRHTIGAEASQAMTSHTHDDEKSETLQNIPPDKRPKPGVSRFRADHMAAAYDRSTSTSLGPTVIPASRQKSLQETIKMGKIENDQLVGGEQGESGSEDETVREILELLKNGRIENTGPDFAAQSAHMSKDASVQEKLVATTSISTAPKLSKFKMARGAFASEQPSQLSNPSIRSLPQSPVSEVVERRQFKPNRPQQRVVDPPSALQPVSSATTTISVKAPPLPESMVVESSSFPSMIVDSPSFPRRTQPSFNADTSRPQRPPVIMRSTVTESNGGSGRTTSDTSTVVPSGRISRFKAERMDE